MRTPLIAVAVGALLAPMGWPSAEPASAGTARTGGLTVEPIGDDAFVARPAGEDLADVVQPVGVGYALMPGVAGYGVRNYTIELIDSPGVEGLRNWVEAAAAQIAGATGLSVTVAPGTFPEHVSLPGEVVVRTATSSGCGFLSSPGVAGCGGPRTLAGLVMTGEVSVAPQVPCDSVAISVVAHELGHAFGLAHYTDSVNGLLQLMYPSTISNAPQFRSGDLAGLAAIAGRAVTVPSAVTVTSPFDVVLDDTLDVPTISQPLTQAFSSGLFSQPPVQRVLNTRSDGGGPLVPGQLRTLSLSTWVGSAQVDAVALNVTTTRAAGSGYAVVFPAGTSVPATSSVNYVAGADAANLVIVKVGPNNSISMVSSGASVDLIADLFGVFSPAGTTAFVASDPARVLDTRASDVPGERGFPLGCGDAVIVDSDRLTAAGLPTSQAVAAVVNLTAVAPTAAGFVSLLAPGSLPSPGTDPTTSNLNVSARATRANLAVTPGAQWFTQVSNSMQADVLADLAGWFVPPATSTSAARLLPVDPGRILDTRINVGLSGRFGVGQSRTLPIPLPAGFSAAQVTAVVLNVTVADATAGGYLTVSPTGLARPNVSNVNYDAGQAVPNLAIVKLGAGGALDFFAFDGSPNVIADVMGYFVSA